MTTHRTSKRRLAAGTAVVLAAMLTATACGGNAKDDEKPAASGGTFNGGIDKVSNPSDKKGGELKFVGTQDADSWDPQRGYYGFMWDFSRYYARQLVSFKPAPGQQSTELVPDLATAKAEISDGGKTYKYTLKDNVTWEDGSPVTAQEIKYGIQRTWPRTSSPAARSTSSRSWTRRPSTPARTRTPARTSSA